MKRNIEDLVKNSLCTGCGVCVSESKGALKMEWDELGFISPVVINDDFSEDVMRVCPFNPQPEAEVRDEDKLAQIFLKDSTNYDDKIGHFENTYAGYSQAYRETSSSGGIATYIFTKLLQEKIVDHLFIVKEVNGSYEYRFFNNVDDITAISKTRYIPVTMEKLFTEIDKLEGKVAVSGVACFIKAIRLKQHYHPELKNKIPFLIGIICGGWKSKFFTDYLAQNSGIEGKYRNQEYRIKDAKSTASDYSFGAFDEKSDFHQMKMAKVGDMWGTGLFKSYACEFCTDVLTELADISLGDAWLPEYRTDGLGTSVIVTRTALADGLINQGILSGELIVKPIVKDKIIESQSSSFKHRRDAQRFRKRLAWIKGERKLPYVRKRVFRSINLPYAMVQTQRLITRKHSLEYWRDTKELGSFNNKMKNDLKRLRFVTQVYHKLIKFKLIK